MMLSTVGVTKAKDAKIGNKKPPIRRLILIGSYRGILPTYIETPVWTGCYARFTTVFFAKHCRVI